MIAAFEKVYQDYHSQKILNWISISRPIFVLFVQLPLSDIKNAQAFGNLNINLLWYNFET